MSASNDFSSQTFIDAQTVTIIATELTFTADLIDPTRDFVIYADSLTFDDSKGAIWFPGRNIKIVARQLTAKSISTEGSPPAFGPPEKPPRTSDDPRVNNGNPNGLDAPDPDPKDNGRSGGSITITAGSVIGHLALSSRGGLGRAGQDGGDAGNGAPGQPENDVPDYVPGGKDIGTPGGPGGRGGTGGLGALSCPGGSGGAISLATLLPPKGQISLEAWGGDCGARSSGGSAGAGGPGGIGGDIMEYHYPPDHWIKVGSYATGATGPPGSIGGSRGFPEPPGGPDGSKHTEVVTNISTQVAPDDYLFAQLQLEMQYAKLKYLDADYGAAGDVLTWVYALSEGPSTTSSDKKWDGLFGEARTYLRRLLRHLDYFGNVANFVPLASFSLYCSSITSMLTLGAHIEDTFNTYTAYLADQTKTYNGFKSAFDNAEAAMAAYRQSLTDAFKARQDLWDECLTLMTQVEDGKDKMMHAKQEFQDAVAKKAECMQFMDIIKIITMIVQVSVDVSSAMSSIAEMTESELNKAILNNVGKVPDGYLKIASIISKLKSDFSDAGSQYDAIQSQLDTDGPDSAKLASSVEDFDIQLQPYMDMPEAVDYKLAVHQYAAICNARNLKLTEVAKCDELTLCLTSKILATQSQLDTLKGQMAAGIDPTLAPYRTFILHLYESYKSTVFDNLASELMAFRYATLQDFPALVASTNTLASFDDLQTKILQAQLDYENDLSRIASPFVDFAVRTSSLAPLGWQSAFSRNGSVGFSIPLTSPVWAGWANVRALTFRVELLGLQTPTSGDGLDVYISLACHGDSTIVDADGKRHDFTHNTVDCGYEYQLQNDGRIVYKAGGSLADGANNSNPSTIALSPFCTWTLSVPSVDKMGNKLNVGVDLTSVKDIVVYFSGKAVPAVAVMPKGRQLTD